MCAKTIQSLVSFQMIASQNGQVWHRTIINQHPNSPARPVWWPKTDPHSAAIPRKRSRESFRLFDTNQITRRSSGKASNPPPHETENLKMPSGSAGTTSDNGATTPPQSPTDGSGTISGSNSNLNRQVRWNRSWCVPINVDFYLLVCVFYMNSYWTQRTNRHSWSLT